MSEEARSVSVYRFYEVLGFQTENDKRQWQHAYLTADQAEKAGKALIEGAEAIRSTKFDECEYVGLELTPEDKDV